MTKGTYKSSDEDNPRSSAFATDLIGKKERSCLDDVQLWGFGHTHYCSESVCGQVKLVSNQRGYVLPNMDKMGSPETPEKLKSKVLKFLPDDGVNRGAFYPGKVIEV